MTPRTRVARTPLAVALTVATCTAALAGCSGDDEAAPTPTPLPTSVTAPPLPGQPTFSGTPAGAAADVKVVDCPTDEGNQVAKVEVTNSTKKARDYAVMVIWLRNGSGTPLGSGLVKVSNVAPGKKVEQQVKAKVVAKADKCALNVMAGSLKS